MSNPFNRKNQNPIETIAAITLGVLAVICFVSQIFTATDKTTGLESVLFNLLQFVLTVGFTWFTSRAISRSEFERSIKQFAISAYRRISDIEKITNRLKNNVSNMVHSSQDENQNDFRVIEAIVEDTRHIVKSSIDDWTDVIGDELIALERMRRLEREKNELQEQLKSISNDSKKIDFIKNIEKQIITLRSKIPSNLLVVSRQDENYPIFEGSEWLSEIHNEQGGFQFKVVAGGDYTTEPDPEKLDLNQRLFTRKTKGFALDVVDSSGAKLGRMMKPLPTDYDTSVKIMEHCYGTAVIEVEFIKIIKKYKMHGKIFIHYLVRIISPPNPEKLRVIVTE